jgi:two-component system, chemotaxis family, CheB/CheR fusion protein
VSPAETRHGSARSARSRERDRHPRRLATEGANDAAPVIPIVGIGASAGGLEAFKQLFRGMPADSGAAFVLIQHLDPTRESLTAELVGTYTPMRVTQAKDGARIEANRIYVIPPNKYLSIRERTLQLSAPAEPRSLRMAIDFFLRSLAEDQRERAIGIILSGTGTDGTLGLKDIKAAGGMTMVQDPRTAQHDRMPRSASGSADHVLPTEQMAGVLLAYVRHAWDTARSVEPAPEKESDALTSAVALLRDRTQFDFSAYKKGTLRRRVQRRMSLKRLDRMPEYVELLRGDPAEVTALFRDLLISVTSFFREPAGWQALQELAIRRLVAEKEAGMPLRFWVPACATGEEAYSVAIALIEEIESSGNGLRPQVFASDVDAEALEAARAGIYPEGIAADVRPDRLSRFFVKKEHSYRVSKELRETVVFAQQNLTVDPPFSRLDLVSCRNLLIYLEPALQEKVIGLLHFGLVEGGYLFLGGAESIGSQEHLFETVSRKWRIYRRIGPTRHDEIEPSPVASPLLSRSRVHPPARPTSRRLAAVVQHLLLQRYVPACVVIDRNSEIRYLQGDTQTYLVQPSGVPTQNLVAQARSELRSKLRGLVHEAFRRNQRASITGVPMRRGGAIVRVGVSVEPLDATPEVDGLWLVAFEDDTTPVDRPASEVADGDETVMRQLEHELSTTKEDLQQSIEDLRAANEELMSANEELQASNEELETSKEELQSLNEELTTTNGQLESKMLELGETNNDLDNLLVSTNIATLFLDTGLRVRRFTPAATRLFSLLSSDIGRPISDIAQKFVDPALITDATAVLEQPSMPKREVEGQDGRRYVRQVLPYRTRENQIEGVVITFSDVAAEALDEARVYAESIVDTVREPLLVLDGDLRVRSANQSFYETFRVSKGETVGRTLYELGNRQWDLPRLRTLPRDLSSQPLSDLEVEHEFEAIGLRTMLLSARTIDRGPDKPQLILLAIEDVTERKRAQQALLEKEARKQLEEQVRRRQAELAHALRISTVGVLASGLAHELNQPLSAIVNGVEASAQYVRSGRADPETLLALLDDASSEALRAGDIVRHLRSFIQKGTPQPEDSDLNEIVRGVQRLMGREVQQERVTLRLDLRDQPIPIHADPIQIEQIVVNLIQNAMDALPDEPAAPREVEVRTRAVKGMAELAVRDNGAGVPEESLERIFEPFFSTKSDGLGMGLAISRSLIEAHRGRIWAEHPDDGSAGMKVCFHLPLKPPRSGRKRRSP